LLHNINNSILIKKLPFGIGFGRMCTLTIQLRSKSVLPTDSAVSDPYCDFEIACCLLVKLWLCLNTRHLNNELFHKSMIHNEKWKLIKIKRNIIKSHVNRLEKSQVYCRISATAKHLPVGQWSHHTTRPSCWTLILPIWPRLSCVATFYPFGHGRILPFPSFPYVSVLCTYYVKICESAFILMCLRVWSPNLL